MKFKGQYLIFIIFAIIALFITALSLWRSSWHESGPVEAAAFGISPPHFQNLYLKPGDTYERTIT